MENTGKLFGSNFSFSKGQIEEGNYVFEYESKKIKYE